MRRVRDWLRYRKERQWAERDPRGYIRAVLGLGPTITDDDIDLALSRMTVAICDSGLEMNMVAERMVALGTVLSEVWNDSTWRGEKAARQPARKGCP